jgi:hypothetical protein
MKNRILKFTDFKKGTPEQKPEKQVDVAGGMPENPKEKAFDQVKRARLAQLDKTEPDYSKVRKMNEDAIADIQSLENQKIAAVAEFDKKIAAKKAEALKQASVTTTTTTAPIPAQPAAPAQIAQPGTPVPTA